jgi:hypothetical protein
MERFGHGPNGVGRRATLPGVIRWPILFQHQSTEVLSVSLTLGVFFFATLVGLKSLQKGHSNLSHWANLCQNELTKNADG